jgi:branched-chain amino acid transport system substrate-binding protein
MKLFRLHTVFASLLTAIVIAGLSACSPSVPDTMKIGLLVAQTGPYGLRGKDLINGAQLAADELNAAGYKIGGKTVKVEIVPFDDKGEIEVAKKGAQALIDQKVAAIIGPLNTPQAVPVIPIIAAQGIPHFFTTTAADLVHLGKGNAFRLLANDDLQGKAMAMFAKDDLHAKRIATIVEKGAYGRGLNKAFVAAMPKSDDRVVVSMDIGSKDMVTTEMAAKIKAANADVVVLFAREPQLKSLFATLKEVGHTDVTVLGTNVVRNKNVATLPIPVKALYATATAIDAIEFPNGKTFLNAFAAKYKSEPIWGAHYAYDGVYALTDAAFRTESLDSAELLETLKRIEPITRVNQQMRFTESGEQRYPNIGVYKVERGQWVVQMVSGAW